MDLNAIRSMRYAEPFRPFTIRLVDGRSEFVKQPESVAIGSNVVVVVGDDDSVHTLEPRLIVSLDVAPPRKRGNGKSKKRRNSS